MGFLLFLIDEIDTEYVLLIVTIVLQFVKNFFVQQDIVIIFNALLQFLMSFAYKNFTSNNKISYVI